MGNTVKLRFDGIIYFRVAVANAIDGGAAGTINILLAIGVINIGIMLYETSL
jgi:hypothetical protein